MCWASSAPLVEIEITDLPQSGDAMAPQARPDPTGLLYVEVNITKDSPIYLKLIFGIL